MFRAIGLVLAAGLALAAAPAQAQRAEENAARAAGDAFGTNIGAERVGLYTGSDVRGFNPTSAGNLRLEGVYFDFRTPPPPRLWLANQVRVGLTAQAYPFPAPTGIVDYALRPVADRPVSSLLLQGGPNQAFTIEYDATSFVTPGKFGLAWNFNLKRDEEQPGDHFLYWGYSANARWHVTDNIELRPFAGNYRRPGKKAVQLVFPATYRLPGVPLARNTAPDWTNSGLQGHVIGLIATAKLNKEWTLLGGVQRMEVNDDGVTSDNYLNTSPDGLAAQRRFTNLLPFDSDSWSGEARLSGAFTTPGLGHVVHVSLRGRNVYRFYGGAGVANFANSQIGLVNGPLVEPNWNYGVQSLERIKQWSGGVSWQVIRRDLGSVGLGVQKVDYKKSVEAPFRGGRPLARSEDAPLFWNGQASWTPSRRLAFYGAFTRGLEEAPIAPDIAANAQEVPDAIRTKQWEAGLRYVVTPKLRLIVGWFDIEKPYFNLDQVRLWRELGVERHSGLEVSLTGEVLPGLNLVGGLVHMEPIVTGEAVDAGLIGEIPVGQPRDTARIAFDYRRNPTDPLSLEGAVNYFGERPVSSREFAELGGKQLQAPGYATVDAGFRYRFAAAGKRSTVRVQMSNIFDDRHWVVNLNGGLGVVMPRRFFVSLTTDF